MAVDLTAPEEFEQQIVGGRRHTPFVHVADQNQTIWIRMNAEQPQVSQVCSATGGSVSGPVVRRIHDHRTFDGV